MHIVDRATLEAELAVRIKSALKAHKHGLASRLTLESEKAVDAVVAEIINVVDNAGSCVVRTEIVHHKMRRGVFGDDEPWPSR